MPREPLKPTNDLVASSGMVDIVLAGAVDITLDQFGKLWVNVDGKCVLRIGHCNTVTMDDPLRGHDTVYGE